MLFFRKREKRPKSVFREYLKAIIWALFLAFVIRIEAVQAYTVMSGSMEPTLMAGDHMLVNKAAYGIKLLTSDRVLVDTGEPERGDVVVFRFPGSRYDLIKRIIGLPGETVEVHSNAVYIDGKKLNDPWGRGSAGSTPRFIMFNRPDFGPVRVPENQYFVMGDNRDNSYDSRYWNNGAGGFVPRRDILGKPFFIHWSWRDNTWEVRWSRLGTIIH